MKATAPSAVAKRERREKQWEWCPTPLIPNGTTEQAAVVAEEKLPDMKALSSSTTPTRSGLHHGARSAKKEATTHRRTRTGWGSKRAQPSSTFHPATTAGQEGGSSCRAAVHTLPHRLGRPRVEEQLKTKAPQPAAKALIEGALPPPAGPRAPKRSKATARPGGRPALRRSTDGDTSSRGETKPAKAPYSPHCHSRPEEGATVTR
jgi:hypothetical protein